MASTDLKELRDKQEIDPSEMKEEHDQNKANPRVNSDIVPYLH